MISLERVTNDVINALIEVDSSGVPFRSFAPGVGPYGEPQLLKLIRNYLRENTDYGLDAITKRTPDLLIPGQWALEFKIVRPFGDNGKEAENWTVNLLHPYPGSTSSIGDCLKLLELPIPEQKAVFVIGFEHIQAKIDLTPLIIAFELIAERVVGIRLGPRVEVRRSELIHPIHQSVRVFSWEVLSRATL
jgi:hypothetical protein